MYDKKIKRKYTFPNEVWEKAKNNDDFWATLAQKIEEDFCDNPYVAEVDYTFTPEGVGVICINEFFNKNFWHRFCVRNQKDLFKLLEWLAA